MLGKKVFLATAIIAIAVFGFVLLNQGITGFYTVSAQEETIKIGALMPLTGFGDLGEKMRKGADLAVEEFNAKRGVNGRKIELIYEDSQCKPATGLSGLQKLISANRVKTVVGPLCSGVTASIAPTAEESQVILMHAGIAPSLRNVGEFIFRNVPGAGFLASGQADFAAKEMGIKKVALLFANTDFGAGYTDAFKEGFEKNSGSIVAAEGYGQGATDFRTQLAKIKDREPEAIVIAGSPDEMGLAMKQMKELGINATIFMPPSAESPVLLDAAGSAAEGAIYSYGFNSEAKEGSTADFIRKYEARYDEGPSWHSAVGYDAVYIYALALEHCNPEDSICIKNQVHETEFEGAQGKLSFDEFGDATMPLVIKTVKNGEFTSYKS